jgi:hypothetical protein
LIVTVKIIVFWDVVLCSLQSISMFSVEEYTDMEAENSSKTVVMFYQITWCQVTQRSNLDALN